LNVSNSIVANNTDESPAAGDKAPDCAGTLTSQGYNLVRDTANCTFTTSTGDLTGVDPLVGPLTDNGGPVSTRALLSGSPAVGAGNPAAPGAAGACAATDARGVPRSNCDMGAYELVVCQQVAVNRIGTEGKDTLMGTSAADGFLALGGNDTVRGLGGRDGLCLGNGIDLGAGGGGKDRLLGERGKDRLKGQGGNDRMVGGPGKDTCAGGPGKKDKARQCEETKSVP
jgi:Ca2+-binding RTX toxin-like protein